MVAQTGFEVVDVVSLEAANKFDLDGSRRDARDRRRDLGEAGEARFE
jgi:hypothetical protein